MYFLIAFKNMMDLLRNTHISKVWLVKHYFRRKYFSDKIQQFKED